MFYQTTGEELWTSWLHYASSYRHEPKVTKSRKEHKCAIGCTISEADHYLKFDIMDGDGSMMSVGLCHDHYPALLEKYDHTDNPEGMEISELLEHLKGLE